jgi:Flp pilus assembly protein TadG
MGVHSVRNRRSGQAAIEFALLYSAVLLPLTFGIVYVAEMYWVWHTMADFTRSGARYAATHCADTTAVTTWMQTNVPPTIDRSQFQPGGSATVNVAYQLRDPATGVLNTFDCSDTFPCEPDAVTVSVTNYEFRRFVTFLHLSPVVMPSFSTSVAMQSAGIDPELLACVTQ